MVDVNENNMFGSREYDFHFDIQEVGLLHIQGAVLHTGGRFTSQEEGK